MATQTPISKPSFGGARSCRTKQGSGERDGPSQRIPPSHLARIRTLLKYGITAHQAAEMYGISVSDLVHLLRQA